MIFNPAQSSQVYSVNSCSGGKSSSYMYLRFPADYSVFAFVDSSHPRNAIQDSAILAYAQKKLDREVLGSMEHEETIKAMVELEQHGGREISWVTAGFSYEEMVYGQVDLPGRRSPRSPMLPKANRRFCTEQLKVIPIFEWCYLNIPGLPLMNIGYRADEAKRVSDANCKKLNFIHYPFFCDIQDRYSGCHRWTDLEWRAIDFPMYRAGITKLEVDVEMAKTGIKYPFVSNCVGCFFHRAQEMLYQERAYPGSLEPWIEMEERVGATFRSGISVKEILAGKKPKREESGSCLCSESSESSESIEGQLELAL